MKYLPIVVQVLLTILLISHWARGLDFIPILILWTIMWGLSLSPLLDIIYGNDDDRRI